MKVSIVRVSKGNASPAGELELRGSDVLLHYNDYLLFRVFKALASRSLCSKIEDAGRVTKHLCKDLFGELLLRLRRPFFTEVKDFQVPWKYTERLGANHA